MKDRKTLRNIAIAFGFFVFWGNLVSLLLPASQHGTAIKIVDFASLVFILLFLIIALIGMKKEQRNNTDGNRENDLSHRQGNGQNDN